MAFKVTCSGILKQGHHIVGEIFIQESAWGTPSQCGVFREGCRILGGEFDFHRSEFKPPRKPILARTEFSSSSRCWRKTRSRIHDRLKLVLETSSGNRLRSPASLSKGVHRLRMKEPRIGSIQCNLCVQSSRRSRRRKFCGPNASGKQRPTTRNRLKNNSSKVSLKQKTLAVLTLAA